MSRYYIPVQERGPGIYAKPDPADARIFFERYVRRVKPETTQQIEHLRSYGRSIIGPSADKIIERVMEQEDLY